MVSNYKLHTVPASANGLRVALYAALRDIKFEFVTVNLPNGEHKGEPYLKINPRGQIPALEDGDTIIYESVAIIDYLEKFHEGGENLIPDNKKDFGTMVTRIAEFHQKLDGKNILGSVLFQKKTAEEMKDRIDALIKEIEVWDSYLEGRDYLANILTKADVIVYSFIASMVHFGLNLEKDQV